MRGALGGPRVLLRRLREVMAEQVSAQERLDKIVVLIAANMVAEVCSVYVLRVDSTLELYATEGLNKAAVHQTVLRSDEGLVGLVASEANPINLSDAQNHPAFSYRAETGEEIDPQLLPGGSGLAGRQHARCIGRAEQGAAHLYRGGRGGVAQTTAMVLAEMIASGELSAIAKPGAEPAARRPIALSGLALNDGIALGHVVLHEPRVVITNFIADDVPKELQRLEAAVETMRSDLDVLLEREEVADGGEHRDVLEAYRMFAYDRGWVPPAGKKRWPSGPHRRGRGPNVCNRITGRYACCRCNRSVSARAPARSRRARQPLDASVAGAGLRASARPTARERGSRCPFHGAGSAA